MTAWRFTTNARMIRRVVIDSDGSIAVTNNVDSWFGAQWIKTTAANQGTDRSSPRRLRSDLLRFRTGILAPAGDPLRAGDRVELEGATYEVLEDQRPVIVGRHITAAQVPIQDIRKLYPLEGALAEQGGTPVVASVRFSLYSVDESHESTGTYEDYSSECDISLHADVGINKNFVSGGNVYKIVDAELDRVGAYVKMTVRKSGGQG